MRTLLLVSVFGIGMTNAFADPVMAENGDVYQGTLYINEHPTTKSCQITIQSKNDIPTLGANCTKIQVIFNLGIAVHGYNHTPESLFSSITNYQLPEYPVQKTCALNRDGTPLSKSIYSANDEQTYNRILSGDSKSGWVSFDYFVIISPETRLPISARLHRLGVLNEDNYDCENLLKVN